MSSAIIVIPCYNEAQRLQIHQFKDDACEGHAQRFLFVNDGSTDGTLKVLQTLRDEDPQRYAICDLPRNVGKAEAVRRGVLLACDADPDYVGYGDADLATPLEAIPAFCELLDARPDLEIVFGARVRLLGRAIARSTLRHYLGRMFATAASVVWGMGVYDTPCGAKLFRASPAIRSLFQEPFLTRWLFDVEILARLLQARRGTRLPPVEDIIYEFPLDEWHDVAGSKVRARDFAKAFVGLAMIYGYYLRLPAPLRTPGQDAAIAVRCQPASPRQPKPQPEATGQHHRRLEPEDAREGPRAFAERREPHYQGR
jgi:dolichyl-phosphate beta-glucosyltransferase